MWILKLPLIFLLLVLVQQKLEAYKILVYSTTFSKSHIVSNARIADVLALDGHDVTLLELHYELKPGIIEASKHAKIWRETFEWPEREDMGDWKAFITATFLGQSVFESHFQNQNYHARYLQACDCLLNNTKFLEKMRAEKFDVFIGEQLTLCGSGISHLAGIKTHVWLSSCPAGVHFSSLIGLPIEPSYVPAVYANDNIPDRMTMRQRLTNLMRSMSNYLSFVGNGVDGTTALFRRRFGPSFPDIRKIVGESPLVLASIDELVDFPRPTSPRVLNIGGLGLRDVDKELKSLNGTEFGLEMEKGKKGVILFSLGSMVPTPMLPDNVIANVLKAFSHLPDYHFIVRVDKEDEEAHRIGSKIPNVFLSSWAPQLEILAHKRLLLFVSHAGYNSLLEAARFAKPMITMGIFGDQPSNALLAERNGWGKAFDKAKLMHSHEEFEELLGSALRDESLQTNAKRAQRLFLTRPMSAEERLTKWMKFLEANDGRLPELTPHSINMSFIELHNLDLIGMILLALILVVWITVCVLKKVWRLVLGDGGKKKRE